MATIHRRTFVSSALAGAMALGDFGFLKRLAPLSAEDVRLVPDRAPVSPDVEGLVRMIEETDRGDLLAKTAERIRTGTSYQELLTALMLAGVRGIRPRPVGFKFHAVLVVNSAHQASLAARDQDRWLPLFWALDNFKVSQARNQQEGGWMMPPVDEAKLPPSHKARERFIAAMDDWDEEGADLAIAALVRSASANEVIEIFWRYGARDFRDIGHKAIYVANAWRTLQTIGWRHAEPIMRSLAYAILEHEGDNPARRDANQDRPGRDNLKRLESLRQHWVAGIASAEATRDLLTTLRTGSPEESSSFVVETLNKGIDPSSLWDGVFLGAGELLMRQPGIVGLHTVTTANALHYAYQTAASEQTRAFMLLQAAAFLPMFRAAMKSRGQLREDVRIDTLEPIALGDANPIEEIFAEVSRNRQRAAQKTLSLLARDPAASHAIIDAGRRLVFNKGTDSHDYKFSSAILEDFYHASPAQRPRLLASAMFNLRGTGDNDNALIRKAREIL